MKKKKKDTLHPTCLEKKMIEWILGKNELIKIASNKVKFKNSMSLLQGNASAGRIALPLEANHVGYSDLSETLFR